MKANDAVAAYYVARGAREGAVQAEYDAVLRRRTAVAAEAEARYLATVSVPCPYCDAAIGEACIYDLGVTLHGHVTHGVRQDASGVNGSFSQKLHAVTSSA